MIIFILLWVKGMENVNFTIFGGFVVSLLASIGVLQTPNVRGGFPAHLRCPRLLGIGVLQTPLAGMRSYLACLTPSSFDSIGVRQTPA